jgi:integrase
MEGRACFITTTGRNWLENFKEKQDERIREYVYDDYEFALLRFLYELDQPLLGIEKKVSTYVARHTFSTIMKRSGVSTEFIQESLGHTSMKTTESWSATLMSPTLIYEKVFNDSLNY